MSDQRPDPDERQAGLDELRGRLESIEEVPLAERPALFEELDRRISDELAELEEV